MQMAALEFARNVCGLSEASSKEFADKESQMMVIDSMESQIGVKNKGATMRLGSYPCTIQKNTKAFEIYKTQSISERHRHRFELNNEYREILEKKRGCVFPVSMKKTTWWRFWKFQITLGF